MERREDKTLRYSPRDPDSLLVERYRLSRGEAFYQFFSAGLSFISLSLILVPSALMFYLLAKRPPKGPEKKKLPRILEFSSLNTLLEAEKPTIIFYHTELSLKTKVYRLVLSEILHLYGKDIDIVETKVDVSKESALGSEVKASGGFLFHLLIPGKEPMVANLDNFASVSSFIEQILSLLAQFGIKVTGKSLRKLDLKVSILQKCLALDDPVLHKELETRDDIDDMISQCNRMEYSDDRNTSR
ncbi:hypothetical protein BEWA_004360 [Theileria equi strain WA]|uniref:Uncharacterized protein n=1 Tax=Theileria equi strain WA TaxID=1537102 RepID=L0B0K3_THEEQ|nr:hypothetical protein BEWA_004360 [Theileria equi strain WA]AFZ81028.1 hypothetical protein BEWA_004360 [Theileria equi strain WA]|eukprot:XP_004830694.1 hypothetical protein BEWA_004360 [Theileria equi strain WA]